MVSKGKVDQAEPLFRRSLAIHEKALGPDHPDTAAALNNLAVLYDEQGKYGKAEPLYQRSLAILEENSWSRSPGYCRCPEQADIAASS